MYDFSQPLGAVIKKERHNAGLTQKEVSILLDMDYRTLQNIETGKGNPSMEKLYPLVRLLKVDPNEIFYPETIRNSPAMNRLHLILTDCTETEADTLIPIVLAVLNALRKAGSSPLPVE